MLAANLCEASHKSGLAASRVRSNSNNNDLLVNTELHCKGVLSSKRGGERRKAHSVGNSHKENQGAEHGDEMN